MERYLCWYLILLKHEAKRVTTWILLALITLSAYLIHKMVLPNNQNTQILIVNEDGIIGEQFIQSLVGSDHIFEFKQIGSEKELKDKVISGQVDCGFVIRKGFDLAVRNCSQQKLITCFTSSFSSKSSTARETVYAEFYKIYSDYQLIGLEDKLFGVDDETRREQMLQKNHEFLISNEVLQVEVKNSSTKPLEMENFKRTDPFRGTLGLFLFMAVLIARSEDIAPGKSAAWNYRSKVERRLFLLVKYAATITIPTVFGGVLMGMSSKQLFGEVILLMCYALICCVWGYFFGRWFSREDTYVINCLSLLILHIIFCPIFIDIRTLLPAAGVLGYIFPLNIYLKICSLIF